MAEPARNYRYRYDYTRGNTARQPVEYPDEPRPAGRPAPERAGASSPEGTGRKTVRNGARTIAVVKSDAKKVRVSPASVITLLIIFAGALGIVMMSAAASNAGAELATVNAGIKAEQENVDSLRTQLASSQNLAQIEDIAVNKLGMGRPKPYQIIHIDVPEESYVVSDTTDSPPPECGGFSLGSIPNFVVNLFGGQPK
ncbi:MAG: hypothetical protein FWC55_03715 [Firmicutes bacterium]|nr:hypothetical protein [Bacillota bacterium]